MDHIDQENTLHASSFFKEIPEDVLACTTIKHSWDTTSNAPKLTGMPPHVSIVAKFEELKQTFEEVRKNIKADVEEQLNARGVGGNEFHANKILQVLEDAQRKVDLIACNNNNFDDNVVYDDSYQNMCGDEEDDTLMHNPDDDPKIVLEMSRRNTAHSKSSVKRRRLTMGCYSGKLQVLSLHWKFPRMTGKQLIDN